MEKIARWWAVFLTELEAGKRVALFYTVVMVTFAIVSITLYRSGIKKDEVYAKKESIFIQRISDITDTCNARERRDRTEANEIRIQMLIDQLKEAKRVTTNAESIIKNNKRILNR